MNRLIPIALTLFAATASAQGLTDMSDAEREAFRAEVRAYLLDNPEVIMEAVGVLEERKALEQVAADRQLIADNMSELTEDGYSYVAGNPDGAITIVEFLDYRCGYCKRSHPEVQALLENNDDIRLVIKEFPILGPESEIAARAATSVLVHQRDLYHQFSDLLMNHTGPINEITLGDIATDAGVDSDLMFANMNGDLVTEILTKNHLLAREMSISGTPTFIIGSELVRGYIQLDMMQQMVEEIRASL